MSVLVYSDSWGGVESLPSYLQELLNNLPGRLRVSGARPGHLTFTSCVSYEGQRHVGGTRMPAAQPDKLIGLS